MRTDGRRGRRPATRRVQRVCQNKNMHKDANILKRTEGKKNLRRHAHSNPEFPECLHRLPRGVRRDFAGPALRPPPRIPGTSTRAVVLSPPMTDRPRCPILPRADLTVSLPVGRRRCCDSGGVNFPEGPTCRTTIERRTSPDSSRHPLREENRQLSGKHTAGEEYEKRAQHRIGTPRSC